MSKKQLLVKKINNETGQVSPEFYIIKTWKDILYEQIRDWFALIGLLFTVGLILWLLFGG